MKTVHDNIPDNAILQLTAFGSKSLPSVEPHYSNMRIMGFYMD